MGAVVSRLVLQIALATAFGAGQLILAIPAAPSSLAHGTVYWQPTASVITTTPPAPVGVGWG